MVGNGGRGEKKEIANFAYGGDSQAASLMYRCLFTASILLLPLQGAQQSKALPDFLLVVVPE